MDCFYKFKTTPWMIGSKPLKLTPSFEKNETKDDIKKKFQQVVERAAVVAVRATIANPFFSEIKQVVVKQPVKVAVPLFTDIGISTTGPVDSELVETLGGGALRRTISLTNNLNTLVEDQEEEYPEDPIFFKGKKGDSVYDDDDNEDEDEGGFEELRCSSSQRFTPMETIFEVDEEEGADL